MDIWQEYYKGTEHHGQPTYDLTRNLMAKAISDKVAAMRGSTGHSSRFDRICLHSRRRTGRIIEQTEREEENHKEAADKGKEKIREKAEERKKEEEEGLSEGEGENTKEEGVEECGMEKGTLGDWQIKRVDMFGTDAIWTSPKGEPVFMSDHFGLIATLLYHGE